jgi:uroporphyrinogen decarboxylase
MTRKEYRENVARFEEIVRNRKRDETMVALIIDSPWLPGFAGMDTRDFFFDTALWLAAYEKAHEALPEAVFIPDVWVELGMAAEPSGFGVPIQWHGNMPPSILPFPGGLQGLVDADTPDPERDGLMPMMLQQYERMKPLLAERGMPPRMAAARGPLAVASHLAGLTELLMATQIEPEKCLAVVEKTTELCIRWLRCQLDRMDDPVAVLVLDDGRSRGRARARRRGGPHQPR